jgi:1-acyl-sn-glycerol-3-phosphate acyltransferase
MNTNIVYIVSRTFCWLVLKVFTSYKVHGLYKVPLKGRLIIAGNHASYLDPPGIGCEVRRGDVHYIAKAELFKGGIKKWLFSKLQCIPAGGPAQDFETVRSAMKLLKNDNALVIFPEGTRSVDGDLKQPEMGIGLLACRTSSPVMPVYISGTYKALPKGSKFIRFGSKVRVHFGELIDFHTKTNVKPGRQVYAEVSKRIMDEIARIKKETETDKGR